MLCVVVAIGCSSSQPPADGTPVAGDLRFAVVGDTRPANVDGTTSYPTQIITKIWQDIAAESPPPAFAVSTGDYMFASTKGHEHMPQLAKYMAARAAFAGPQYPAMGNHECTGATASNCGTGQRDGITPNLAAFVDVMLRPVGVTRPYYVEHVAALDASWTAKLVFVACNAWDAAQQAWLGTTLAESTTYTFVIRHESVAALPQTPCAASQPIIDAHPLTLLVVGHTHSYSHQASNRELVVGNGGAPLTGGTNYGYVIVARNPSGTLTVTAYDYLTHRVLDTFDLAANGGPG